MPTYEYECTVCGQHIEVFQRFSEDALTTCGVCGGKLRKVFHPAGIVFKGSGFYATDSRSKSLVRRLVQEGLGRRVVVLEGSSDSSGSSGSEGGSGSKGGDGGSSSKGSNGGSSSTSGSKKEPTSS